MLKEIECLKYNINNQSPTKTSETECDRNKNLNSSILSEIEEYVAMGS